MDRRKPVPTENDFKVANGGEGTGPLRAQASVCLRVAGLEFNLQVDMHVAVRFDLAQMPPRKAAAEPNMRLWLQYMLLPHGFAVDLNRLRVVWGACLAPNEGFDYDPSERP
ncbi:uncharacterized protein PSANT_01349 [Moesziomyces antarcticus]|uniref:Uncharacterized protein n=2 Tax=Pseudozyma antarctica TaxID=84753 RepID=A0A5C3FGY1_PSEA2|nr:uncharacterized protein PSANT_01349 [Moesziomyces antarcticus]